MARRLQVFSLLSRLYAPSGIPSVSLNSWRFASRGSSKAWMGQIPVAHGYGRAFRPRSNDEASDGDQGLEDVEDKIQALIDEEKKRQKTVKYHKLKRQMTPSGPPQRKLTWDAIEQIRYLKQEQPEEWTVERLAEGFSVTPDVILRVLKSKFTPSLDRKAKQDAKAMARFGQQVLPSGAGTQQDKLKLPGSRAPAILPPGNENGALVSVTGQTQVTQDKSLGSSVKSPVPATVRTLQITTGLSKDATLTRSTADDGVSSTQLTEEDEEHEESWDRQVLLEEELEEFLDMDKPSPVVQVGKNFFDGEGNFLYRI